MVKYSFDGSTFVIQDYQHAKRFSSFLPAMAGKDGKPLWAFYANVGQCMGGFGVNNKDTQLLHLTLPHLRIKTSQLNLLDLS